MMVQLLCYSVLILTSAGYICIHQFTDAMVYVRSKWGEYT